MVVSKRHFFSKKSEISVCFIDLHNSFSNSFAAFKAIVPCSLFLLLFYEKCHTFAKYKALTLKMVPDTGMLWCWAFQSHI